MNIWQRIAHKLFGWQYVLFAEDRNKLEVCRAYKLGGVYHILRVSGTQKFFLTKGTMAPNAPDLQVMLSTMNSRYYSSGEELSVAAKWRWAGLTGEVVAHTTFLRDEDDFLPRIGVDMSAGLVSSSPSAQVQNIPKRPSRAASPIQKYKPPAGGLSPSEGGLLDP